jgi:hypothetical protein
MMVPPSWRTKKTKKRKRGASSVERPFTAVKKSPDELSFGWNTTVFVGYFYYYCTAAE